MSHGHIRQRSPGSWELRYRAGGKTRTATFRGAKREAERELRRLMAEADRGVAAAAPARLTLAEWLSQWLEITRGEIRPITSDRYEAAVRLYLVPALGTIRLRDLSPRDIQAAFARWTTAGRYRGTGGLARSTLGLLRKTLHAALQRALELELIARHPMAPLRKRLPTGAAPEAKVIGAEAAAALVDRAVGTPYHSAIVLAVACGLRRGEACGLRWRNVDFDAGELHVDEARVPARKGIATGKTKSGRSRSIRIPEFALALLRQHRVFQAEQLLKLGARVDGNVHVCARADGSPINPMSLSAWCRANSPIGFHGLRHTHASLLLNGGASVKAVSSRLGHSSAALTLGIYAHVLPGADEDAARRIDDLLSGSKRVANKP
jgi:integrase